jgi:small-conductance mechanosensitive channel
MLMMVLTPGNWLIVLLLFCAIVVFGNGIHYIVFRLLHRKQSVEWRVRLGIQRYLNHPARAVLLAISVLIVLPLVPGMPPSIRDQATQAVEVLLVLFLGWLAIGGVYVFQAFLASRFDTTVADNLQARRVHTQIQIFRRVLIVIVVILDAGALLWSLHDERLWKYGTGLMASAGLASLVMALAAKSTASNLLAGMQIALTQPIRIDDVVVIQGHWGRIEEITSTYVVVKIWDERRLIVPLSYIIEQPFENWTQKSADLLGWVYLYVDYSIPIEPLRAELARIAGASPLWDKRVCGLQVTNLTDRVMELRCLVSSANSSASWDLCCLVREKMIEFVRSSYPHSLPTFRVQMGEQNGSVPNGRMTDAMQASQFSQNA